MSSSIFCTFDQMDFADLAMGRVRMIPGVKSIHYFKDPSRAEGENSGAFNAVGFPGAANSAMGVDMPARPASVRVVCDDSVRQRVVSVLVNSHAYRIVSTP